MQVNHFQKATHTRAIKEMQDSKMFCLSRLFCCIRQQISGLAAWITDSFCSGTSAYCRKNVHFYGLIMLAQFIPFSYVMSSSHVYP